VTFAALGNIVANADATPSINKIDVTNPNVPPGAMRQLRIVVNAGEACACHVSTFRFIDGLHERTRTSCPL